MINRLLWYFQRLKKMSLPEIPYRLVQLFRKVKDRYYLPQWIKDVSGESTESIWDQFAGVYDWLGKSQFTDVEKRQLIDMADDFVAHDFTVFGIKKNFGNPINFHLDPKTGKSWPLIYWGKINYRDGQSTGGIKFAWELNRLNHWPVLGLAYVVSGRASYRKEIFEQLRSWLESNPYPLGINWISGIELGIRVVNLFYTLRLVGANNLSEVEKQNIIRFVTLHGYHLYRYPSKYSSAANHALAEALGLFIAGLAFPTIKGACSWKYFGKKVLETEVVRQIYPDGSSFEHSIPYLQFVADHFLIYYLVCKEYGEDCSFDIENRLKFICGFVSQIIDCSGNIPMKCDADDGYLIKIMGAEFNNFISILNSGSILFNRADWIHPVANLDIKTKMIVGEQSIKSWKNITSHRKWNKKSGYFKHAGLAVIKHNKLGKEILFITNFGSLGEGVAAGHGHADALSIWLSVNGKPILIDPGTYLYHSGGDWRRYFRSTAAHNTIEIDGKDQAEQVADFLFDKFYNISGVKWDEDEDVIFCQGEHDGYSRLDDPVIHRREILYSKIDHRFEITDRVFSHKEHTIKFFYHFHPDVVVSKIWGGEYTLVANGDAVKLVVDKSLTGKIYRGSKKPLSGWYSCAFNSLVKTDSLVLSKEITGNVTFKSVVSIL